MNFKIALVIFTVLMLGCTDTRTSNDEIVEIKPWLNEDKVAARNNFIGSWYSEQPTTDGGLRKTTIERAHDGRYLSTFEIYNQERILIQTKREVGLWGVSGGIYFTMLQGWIKDDEFQEANPNDAYYYDAYKIISTSRFELTYQSLSTGNKFTYIKVK
ncbi:hypothetical protein [Alteromonas sp. KUL49]|uniref:hypothetical protein n=1 Tax=Alteromonas sp. KUL49 TaxID=2480798 RepID=UPI00102F071D|nr:hypothetical protein [Alteromonas sp. KUL49]TAP41297.1 hypothetical protein EYS00_03645 [Alteromonas sp. KUL49]